MKTVKTFLTTVIISSLLMSFTSTNDFMDKKEPKNDPKKELAHYPEAKEGMVRYVIFLDQKADESLYKVEIIPGKVMTVDCNRHSLMGKTEEKTVEGWGYNYFDFSSEGKTISTRMACPNQKDTEKFISAQPTQLRYNSKLPLVVYAPKGFEVRYRIWKAGKEQKFSEQ